MSTTADDIEFEIKRLPRGLFRATVHNFRGERWWPADSQLFASEVEAMRWINLRLALNGFEEAYRIGKVSVSADGCTKT
jgi:hypothetical protein